MNNDMKLPDGKTCGDCAHFKRTCEWLISCNPAATNCDWSPSRFVERAESKTEVADGK